MTGLFQQDESILEALPIPFDPALGNGQIEVFRGKEEPSCLFMRRRLQTGLKKGIVGQMIFPRIANPMHLSLSKLIRNVL